MTYALEVNAGIDELLEGLYGNGGATVSLIGETVPAAGYLIGGIDSAEFAQPIDFGHVSEFVSHNEELLTSGSFYLGAWRDSETDHVWLDVVEWEAFRMAALETATKRKEIAVWDLKSGTEIRVNV